MPFSNVFYLFSLSFIFPKYQISLYFNKNTLLGDSSRDVIVE